MSKRAISFTKATDQFLQSYERVLQLEGRPREFIEEVAGDLFEVLFRCLPNGALTSIPSYIGLDPSLPKFSLYRFSQGNICGLYSCSADHVIVMSLSIMAPAASAISARESAA